MPSNINTNLHALGARRHTARSQSELSVALARLSSGLRINSARDDAAGLAISERLDAQVRGLSQAGRNANDAISLVQTAEAALGQAIDNLHRIRELAVQAANPTNTSVDRAALQLEVAQLVEEIDRIATQTQFNGVKLLDGSFLQQSFQIGANGGETIAVDAIGSTRVAALGVVRGFTALNTYKAPTSSQVPRYVQVGSEPRIYTGMYVSSARELAESVNAANVPGLRSVATSTVANGVTSSATASASGTATYTVNGVAIAINGSHLTGSLAANRSAAVAAINAQSGATGVVATDTGSSVRLTDADGDNIFLAYAAGSFSGSTAADFGLSSVAATAGNVSHYYTQPPDVHGDITLWNNNTPYVYTVEVIGQGLGSLTVASASEAETAVSSADAALTSLNASRAFLGAIQNRLQAAIQNLGTTSENLAAARSRIQDADYAIETANLSRAQVLQEAGIAMIAQANQQPGQVLALLR